MFVFFKKRLTRLVFKKLLFAFGAALFFTFLGIIGNFGYQVYSIEEVSFVPHTRLGFADVVFHCNAVFNPILYPYYWLKGFGSLNSNITFKYVSEHPHWLSDTASGGPNIETDSKWYPWGWGITPQERYETYIAYLLVLGIYPNFALLFIITLFVEITDRRLYSMILAGIIGFAFWSVSGMLIGLFVATFILAVALVSPEVNKLLRQLWLYLWE
ncbi:hypothetical protein DRO69_11640 [Candidatus Bathyarchaeota archaeon]|nr:MAG: hypothetical protein DRO69_11640 [Candidatus Bathyarchaeota archaeon]